MADGVARSCQLPGRPPRVSLGQSIKKTVVHRAIASPDYLREEKIGSRARQASFWANVPQLPADKVFSVAGEFFNDPYPQKMNIGLGAYRTEDGKPHILDVVQKVENLLTARNAFPKEYLPITGTAPFREKVCELLFGNCPRAMDGSIYTYQTISGSGALRLGAEFLKAHQGTNTIYVTDPAWVGYSKIFPGAGLRSRKIRYFDYEKKTLDIEGLLEDLWEAEPGAPVALQACCHNPTGLDPTREQWRQILEVMQYRQLLPFFDIAYQGFGFGDLDADAYPLRLFEEAGMEMLVAQSFSKNMGLYGERSGSLSVVCQTPEQAQCVGSQLGDIIVSHYGIPPRHGSDIATAILEDPVLTKEWRVELKGMVDRVRSVRELLYLAMMKRNTPGDWECIVHQVGMFAFPGFSPSQVKQLTSKWHIYLPPNGRMSMAGVAASSVDYLADAIDDVTRNIREDRHQ
ncbi:hypothetical protein BSKO_04823 [Bryopsis sp. KO-2023]|nr:hypothetical protein BSKO_04823 [Bryopsis sp. KO-2023]